MILWKETFHRSFDFAISLKTNLLNLNSVYSLDLKKYFKHSLNI